MAWFSKRSAESTTAPQAIIPPPLSPPAVVDTDVVSKINMRKEKVKVVLRKNGMGGTIARVVVVLDKSGSMYSLYARGVIQRVIERLVPVASALDDDGTLESYGFATTSARLPDVTAATAPGYLKRREVTEILDTLGIDNVEPLVMQDILDYYVRDNPSNVPTLVLFLSDGGIGLTGAKYKLDANEEIRRLLRESSHYNMFWQFIGVGNANFGALERLDTLTGRKVDNANFFSVADLDSIDDDELYQRLLGEYPLWVKAARAAGIPMRIIPA